MTLRETLHARLADHARAASLIACVLAAAACDAPARSRGATPLADRGALRVVASNVDAGRLGLRSPIRITFDRPLEPGSVGVRSVRLDVRGGRRVAHVRVRALGNTLVVSPPIGAALPVGVPLTVRLEGGGSPRALTGTDGSHLAAAWAVEFQAVRTRALDLVAPEIVGSTPGDGDADAAPSSHVEIRFDEPIARAAIRTPSAIVLYVNGREQPSALRLSSDLRSLIVRPTRPLPAGVSAEVRLTSAVHDLAGNPLPPSTLAFRTRATRLHEIAEDFVTTDTADRAATTGGWANPEAPGFLVPRAGRVHWSPADGDVWDAALAPRRSLRLQVVLPGWSSPAGLASALRVSVLGEDAASLRLLSASVEAGPTDLERADPTFHGNRTAARLFAAAVLDEPLDGVRDDDDQLVSFDVPFDTPLALHAGESVLLDIALEFSADVRLAATRDGFGAALSDAEPGLLPAVELLVSGGPPSARSGWFDSGTERPNWREAIVVATSDASDPGFVVEYQTAGSGAGELPDADRSSEWSPSLGSLPRLRFVRFRVRFDGLGRPGRTPRIDRIVLPFED